VATQACTFGDASLNWECILAVACSFWKLTSIGCCQHICREKEAWMWRPQEDPLRLVCPLQLHKTVLSAT
jgi:hypothetical protein